MNQPLYDSARLTQHCAGASAIGLLINLLRNGAIRESSKPAAELYVREWEQAGEQMAKAIEESL